MIARIRRCLIQDIRRRPAQLHPLTLEAQIRQPRDILIAVAKVVGEEQRQALHPAKLGALDGQLLHLGGTAELEFLRGFTVLCSGEIHVIAVLEDAEGPWGAVRVGGAEEDGV